MFTLDQSCPASSPSHHSLQNKEQGGRTTAVCPGDNGRLTRPQGWDRSSHLTPGHPPAWAAASMDALAHPLTAVRSTHPGTVQRSLDIEKSAVLREQHPRPASQPVAPKGSIHFFPLLQWMESNPRVGAQSPFITPIPMPEKA